MEPLLVERFVFRTCFPAFRFVPMCLLRCCSLCPVLYPQWWDASTPETTTGSTSGSHLGGCNSTTGRSRLVVASRSARPLRGPAPTRRDLLSESTENLGKNGGLQVLQLTRCDKTDWELSRRGLRQFMNVTISSLRANNHSTYARLRVQLHTCQGASYDGFGATRCPPGSVLISGEDITNVT